jgi:hypothetical protein
MKLKLADLTYQNWESYYSHLYDYLDNYPLTLFHLTTAEVIIHSVLGLPRNQIHSILLSKFPDKRFNKQYVKSTSNKYKDLINEIKETLQ